MDEILTQTTELIQELTEAAPETVTETVTQIVEVLPDRVLPADSGNMIHQLFLLLGCDLDVVPLTVFECFTMALQFIAAVWFLCWFCFFLGSMMKNALRGGL